jgi:uncharacterized Ntn-hydrolase superfamily protein
MCKRRIPGMLLLAVVMILLNSAPAAATFSIVAVDTANGAIGSAGASCIADAQIIEGIVESIGAVNTQSWWNAVNQQHADSLMRLGLTPDSIIGWLVANDAQSLPTRRQYGVVTLAGPGASAAFTGSGNGFWHGHLTGFGYSIQGNLLLGPEIIAGMEDAWLNTNGPLEDKLMAVLEAADIPGADQRCFDCNKPAISAFIKVVHPGDGDTPYLYEVINDTPCASDPIPLLREKYDLWKALRVADADTSVVTAAPLLLLADGVSTSEITVIPLNWAHELPSEFTGISISHSGEGSLGQLIDNGDGSYSIMVTTPMLAGVDTLTVIVQSTSQSVELSSHPILTYYICGDADGNSIVNISDAVYLISYIFGGGPAPDPLISGDVDCNDIANISDAVYLIAYIFGGGAVPCADCL